MIRFESVTKRYPDGTIAVNSLTLSPALCVLMLEAGHRPPGRFFRWFNSAFKKVSEHYSDGVIFLLRWLHFLAGITWIGLLYYFNLVQVPFFAETEPGVRGDTVFAEARDAATTAAGVDPDGEPSLGWLVVEKNGVTLRTSKGALTAGGGDPGKRRAAVGRARYAGDVDRAGVAAS